MDSSLDVFTLDTISYVIDKLSTLFETAVEYVDMAEPERYIEMVIWETIS